MRILLGLERPSSGSAILYGEPAHRFSGRRALGYLAQRSQLGGDAPATVREVVAAGASQQGAWRAARRGRPRARRRGDRRVGLDAVAPRRCARSPAGCSSARSSRRRSRASRRSSFSTSRQPASTPSRRSRWPSSSPRSTASSASRSCTSRTSSARWSTTSSASSSCRRTIVFDGSPGELPGMWHDPGHVHARE